MTMIFGFTRENVAVLCGDALLTHFAEQSSTSRLPAPGPLNASLLGMYGVSVVGLRQKVNIIGDTVALAWSGSYVEAHGLAREIKSYLDRHGPAVNEVYRIILANADQNLSCIAMVAEGPQTSYIWHGAETANLRRFHNVHFAGSGSDYFKRTIERLDSVDAVADASINTISTVLGDALAVASQSLGRELYTQQTLLERWGGTIEVCYQDASAFVKLDKVAFVHFRFDEATPEAGLTWVPRLLLNRYNGSDLECIALDCEQTSDKRIFSVVQDDTVIVRPLMSDGVIREPFLGYFEYDRLCTHFSYCRAGESLWSMTSVHFCSNGSHPFHVAMKGSRVDIAFRKTLGDWMREQIRSYQQGEIKPQVGPET
ncbi:hypothetical protein [Bradyrhizobium sp. USDA 4451]